MTWTTAAQACGRRQMSSEDQPRASQIAWHDWTVERAAELRNFYSQVVGWGASPVDMGEYSDFNMLGPKSGEAVAALYQT